MNLWLDEGADDQELPEKLEIEMMMGDGDCFEEIENFSSQSGSLTSEVSESSFSDCSKERDYEFEDEKDEKLIRLQLTFQSRPSIRIDKSKFAL